MELYLFLRYNLIGCYNNLIGCYTVRGSCTVVDYSTSYLEVGGSNRICFHGQKCIFERVETINNLYNYIILVVLYVLFTFSEQTSLGLFLNYIKLCLSIKFGLQRAFKMKQIDQLVNKQKLKDTSIDKCTPWCESDHFITELSAISLLLQLLPVFQLY